MATHSYIHAWRIPWTEEPGELQSMGSQRVGHDRVTKHTCNSTVKKSFLCLFPISIKILNTEKIPPPELTRLSPHPAPFSCRGRVSILNPTNNTCIEESFKALQSPSCPHLKKCHRSLSPKLLFVQGNHMQLFQLILWDFAPSSLNTMILRLLLLVFLAYSIEFLLWKMGIRFPPFPSRPSLNTTQPITCLSNIVTSSLSLDQYPVFTLFVLCKHICS